MHKRPDRFQGLAALAMQDPDGATRELERCVKELGFRGALVNGFSQVGNADTTVYYDLPQYRPFWAMAERLDVPFYLHPRNPLPRDAQDLRRPSVAARPDLGVRPRDRGACAAPDGLRPVRRPSAAADHPRPYGREPAVRDVARRQCQCLDSENRHNWPAKKQLSDYFCDNFYVTTSGNFHTQALLNAMLEIGADRIMFSTDWPFENIDHAAIWFDACPISENDRLKIGRENARRLFRLGN